MKKLIFISVTLISLGVFCSFYNTSAGLTGTYTPNQNDSLKLEAFTVLENNCNECHTDKKPKYVFTLANMNAHCADINTQVFLKRKMPKGKENV